MGEVSREPVPPGSGWPEDPASPETPVALDAGAVVELAASAGLLTARQSVCRACPRLVAWREEVAAVKRRSFAAEPYWGRPIAGWGDSEPGVLIVGLAPAAHGGNRTGRVFTGDRSGDFLFRALFDQGLTSSPRSERRDDGLVLTGVRVAAVVRCAPPANKPTIDERDRCMGYLERELDALSDVRVIVALGAYAWDGALRVLARLDEAIPRPRPTFGHGAEARVGRYVLLGSYHPSQQNTFTGRLTPSMLGEVVRRAREIAGVP